jgi:hypothetical protein
MTKPRFLPQWAYDHPLAFVMTVAIIVRIAAVVFSKGFIHSDDHYDTVMIAFDWLNNGLWGPDGWLRWRQEPSTSIGRFPLYVLSLLGVMKLHYELGITTLDSIMYTIRGLHAAVSLLPVWVAYRIVSHVTRSKDWAIGAGLVMALYFAAPFLGVRNLIEVVGGNIWMLVLLTCYIGDERKQDRWLLLAGILAGLAWMIRFQLAFAVLPIPIVLWLQSRTLRQPVFFAVGVGVMLLASGVADWIVLGRFAGSTITNLTMNTGLPPLYRTIPLLYPTMLVLLLVPPISVLAVVPIFRREFIRRHALLWSTCIFFVLSHSLVANQQERFVLPILPAFLLLAALALWYSHQKQLWPFTRPRLVRNCALIAGGLNLVLLGLLTFSYPRAGLIEPLLRIREINPQAHLLVIQPEMKYWMPRAYAGPQVGRTYVRSWSDLEKLRSDSIAPARFDFVLLYPPHEEDLEHYLDSTRAALGCDLEAEFVVPSSFYDGLLYTTNRRHNPRLAAYVYSPSTIDSLAGSELR